MRLAKIRRKLTVWLKIHLRDNWTSRNSSSSPSMGLWNDHLTTWFQFRQTSSSVIYPRYTRIEVIGELVGFCEEQTLSFIWLPVIFVFHLHYRYSIDNFEWYFWENLFFFIKRQTTTKGAITIIAKTKTTTRTSYNLYPLGTVYHLILSSGSVPHKTPTEEFFIPT